ncbi:MAG: nucleoside hydrolase [Christensenellaceae bacterium]|nr:nucleoside hydrolase [Christensenellaceae bacterium]
MRKIIIDCDPGMDDSAAIIYGLKSQKLNTLAITTVNGNYPVDITFRNARRVLNMMKQNHIPVYRGCSKPMVREAPKDPFSHGEDGQANNNLSDPKYPPQNKHAVNAIIDIVKENPNEVTIVCLGPLTNVATAIQLTPEIAPLISKIIAISGAFGFNEASFENATGDTPQSEWNVYVDPEAAKIIYESGIPFTAIGLDVATHFSVDFSDDDLKLLNDCEKAEANFLKTSIAFVRNRGFKAYCAIIDCIAVAYAADEDLVKTIKGRVGVEVKDGLTLGMTVMDRRHHHVWEHLPLIDVAVDANYEKFLSDLIQTFIS